MSVCSKELNLKKRNLQIQMKKMIEAKIKKSILDKISFSSKSISNIKSKLLFYGMLLHLEMLKISIRNHKKIQKKKKKKIRRLSRKQQINLKSKENLKKKRKAECLKTTLKKMIPKKILKTKIPMTRKALKKKKFLYKFIQ